jgi:uncharacterized membrane protein YfcA
VTEAEWLIAQISVLAASVLQTATGAGLGLIAGPALVLVMDSVSAIQVAIILNLALSVLLLPSEWGGLDRRALRPICIGTLGGLPVGLVLLGVLTMTMLKLVAACAIVYATVQLYLGRRGNLQPKESESGSFPMIGAGVVSGAMSASLAMPGPAGLWALWKSGVAPTAARASLRALFVLSYGAALLMHALSGMSWLEVVKVTALLTPALLVGLFAGQVLKRRISESMLATALIIIVATTGVSLLASSLKDLINA